MWIDEHKIETSLEGIDHLSKENINKNKNKKVKMDYYLREPICPGRGNK